MIKRVLIVVVTAASFGTVAHAVPVNFYMEGTVRSICTPAYNPPCDSTPYNLSVGDTVYARATYDDSVISAVGDSFVEFGNGGNSFGWSLTFELGSITLNETNEAWYAYPSPRLHFIDGVFFGFEYESYAGFNGSPVEFSALGRNFEDPDWGLGSSWNLDTLSITPVDAVSVPEPATLALLALGLAGLAVSARRRRPAAVSLHAASRA